MMPKTLRIGPVVYEVKEINRLVGTGNDGKNIWLNGDINYQTCRIRIEQEMDEQLRPEALWHEALHGMLQQAGHNDHPEAMVEALGYAIVQFIRDNPELLAYTLGVNDENPLAKPAPR